MPKQQQTRYERVKAILNEASPNSNAQYMGYGKFWELPLEQLKQVVIYGIRMIAEEQGASPDPVAVKSCCGGDKNVNVGQIISNREQRGAKSGLIKGLRGEYPFDGNRLPRLPWDGEPVADAQIDFIEEWINDGCPEDDLIQSVALEVTPDETATAGEKKIYAVFPLPADEYEPQSNGLHQRRNLDFLEPLELEKLRYAFRELYHLNKWPADRRNYNNQALIHQNHCQHAWERFLPWHRVYMYEFEQALQDVCPGVTLPYWDWTLPRYMDGRFENGQVLGDVIPNSFKAFLTLDSIKYLVNRCQAEASNPTEVGQCGAIFGPLCEIVDELFTTPQAFFDRVSAIWENAMIGDPNVTAEMLMARYRTWLIDALLATNSLWYPLRYPAQYKDGDGNPSSINKVIHYHYPSADDIMQIQSLSNYRDYGGGSEYNDSYGWIDQNPHNTIHIWTGGMNPQYGVLPITPGQKVPAAGIQIKGRKYHSREDLYGQPQFGDMFSNLTASFDPIFWPHHTNVDRLWSEWQREHPHCEPADPSAVLTPWNYTIRDTYDISRFGYEYVRNTCIFPVGLGSPVTRLQTSVAGLPPGTLTGSKKIELRLHRVPQLPMSCYIRIFLNQPDANAQTPWQDNDHFAGYVPIFGHGSCYGGPGHCDIPPERPRRFDLRERSHNTPRNHRLDITKCVGKLAAKGAADLQVTLVVVGVDGREIDGLLRLDSVSLNFRD